MESRRRRLVVVALLALTPSAAIAWAGCSSSSTNSGVAPPLPPDPGGTFGAEVTVTVIGRGRVTTTIPGLNCPSDCFARFVFGDRSEDGAAGGVTLKAIATKNVRFAGWKFETQPLGARGRGPDSCNPIKRDSTSVPVDLQSAEISLPYGQVNGTPPAGQEAFCIQHTAVPAAYSLTATFIDEVVDSGADAGPDVFLESPVAGAAAREIGIAGGRLYWRYEQTSGLSGIATAPTSGLGGAQMVSGSTGSFGALDIGQQNVVWQTTGGVMNVIPGGSTFGQSFASGGNTCVSVDSDFSSVYCRTAGPAGSIISWTTSGTNITSVHTGLPSGTELTLDSTSFYLVDNSLGAGGTTIRGVTRTATPDAGVPTLSTLVTGLTNPTELEVNTSRLFWIDYDTGLNIGIAQSASRAGGTPFTSVTMTGLRLLALDPNSTSSFFVGVAASVAPGSSAIMKLSAFTTASGMVRQNLTGIGGIVADSSYVYWTQSDGRVYRAVRTTF